MSHTLTWLMYTMTPPVYVFFYITLQNVFYFYYCTTPNKTFIAPNQPKTPLIDQVAYVCYVPYCDAAYIHYEPSSAF